MINRVVEVPYALGELISDAILELGLEEEEYDLWYREQPIWLVRGKLERDKNRVFRVQITAFDTNEGVQLHAIPDAYIVDGDKVPKRCTPLQIREAKKEFQPLNLQELDTLREKNKEGAKEQIYDFLVLAWESAKELARNL